MMLSWRTTLNFKNHHGKCVILRNGKVKGVDFCDGTVAAAVCEFAYPYYFLLRGPSNTHNSLFLSSIHPRTHLTNKSQAVKLFCPRWMLANPSRYLYRIVIIRKCCFYTVISRQQPIQKRGPFEFSRCWILSRLICRVNLLLFQSRDHPGPVLFVEGFWPARIIEKFCTQWT